MLTMKLLNNLVTFFTLKVVVVVVLLLGQQQGVQAITTTPFYLISYSGNKKCVDLAGTLPSFLVINEGAEGFCLVAVSSALRFLKPNGQMSQPFNSYRIKCDVRTLETFSDYECANFVETIPTMDNDFRSYCGLPESGLVTSSFRVMCNRPVRKNNCKPKRGLNRKKCMKKIRQCGKNPHFGLKWVGAGCKKNGKKIQKAGCQCREYCGYKCAGKCNADQDCAWNATLNACTHKAKPDVAAPEGCLEPDLVDPF